MPFDSAGWVKRADEVLGKGGADNSVASEVTQFATSMLTVLYGPRSTQLEAFSAGCEGITKSKLASYQPSCADMLKESLGTPRRKLKPA